MQPAKYELCVSGDNVESGAQVVVVEAAHVDELKDALRRAIRFSPPDYANIVELTRLAPEYNRFVALRADLVGLVSGDHVRIYCEKDSHARSDALFYEVLLERMLAASGADLVTARQAIRDAKAAFEASGAVAADPQHLPPNVDAALAKALAPLGAAPATTATIAAASLGTPASGTTTDAPASRKSAPPGSRKAAAPPPAEDVAADADNRNEGSVDIASVSAVVPATPPPTATQQQQQSNFSIDAAPSRTADALLLPTDALTVYCVYTGTTSQRAKAFRISRSCPSIESLLKPLRAKFHADLALGYISEDASCTELLTDKDLKDLVARLSPNATTLTLHCWSRTFVGVSDDSTAGGGGFVDSIANTPRRAASEAGSARKSRPPSAAGSRPVSALSAGRSSARKSSAPQRHKKPTPNDPKDVSGVAWTPEQLHELFLLMDEDGSGVVDKREFFKYMTTSYDSMGVPDFTKRIKQLMESSTEFTDGELSFDEFAVIMLKVAQW